jgi:hypothetical protein
MFAVALCLTIGSAVERLVSPESMMAGTIRVRRSDIDADSLDDSILLVGLLKVLPGSLVGFVCGERLFNWLDRLPARFRSHE